MSLRRARAIAKKEFRHILRDPRSLLMALAIPLILLLLFGYALSLDVDQIPTYITDLDRTPQSRDLIAGFEGSRYFRVEGYVPSAKAISGLIDRNLAMVGVVIPQGFAKDVLSGSPAKVQVIVDGSDSNTATIAVGYLQGLFGAYSSAVQARYLEHRSGMELRPAVLAEIRIWYNETLESKNYIVPGLIAVILMIIASLLTSLTIAREWEMGTMEQLLSTPVRPAELVLGKMAAYFTVGVFDAAVAMTAGALLFQVPLRGSVLLVAGSTCLFLFGALGWGIMLSAVARSQLLAYQMGILSSFLPAFLLSGFVFSIESMPAVIQVITHIVPARYFITILKGVYLKGIGLTLVGGELLFLAAYGFLVFVFATRKVGAKVA